MKRRIFPLYKHPILYDVGLIFADDDKITATNLRVFREFQAEEEHIKVMERFCPNVRDLYLTRDYHRKIKNEHKFMHRLAMSKKINSIKSLRITGTPTYSVLIFSEQISVCLHGRRGEETFVLNPSSETCIWIKPSLETERNL